MVLLQGKIGGGASAGEGKIELVGGQVVLSASFPAKEIADEAMAKVIALLPPGVAEFAKLIVPTVDAGLSVA